MRESKAVRKNVLEKIKQLTSNEPQKPILPQTFAEALQLAADQAKLIEEQAPKVEFHDKVVNNEANHCIRDAAKKIQQRPNKFSQWLKENGYLCQNSTPKQQYINQGLFVVHTGISASEHQFTQTRVTSKGLTYFTNKLGEQKL
jgi:phage antirepressor YoqD-like protein